MNRMAALFRRTLPSALALLSVLLGPLAGVLSAQAAPAHHEGGEATLVVPDLSQVHFGGVDGRTLLTFGLLVCALGLLFGLVIYSQLRRLPVHE